MGREQGRVGQHLLLYIAGIIGIIQIVAGCATGTGNLQVAAALTNARIRMEGGDFRSALMENDKALRQSQPNSMSRVLFQRGLILAHPRNPEPDYTGAADSFRQVIDKYPYGDLGTASEILIAWSHRIRVQEQEIHNLSAQAARLELALQEHQGALKEQQAVIHEQQGAIKEKQGAIDEYQRAAAGRQEQIDHLNSHIGELKSQIENYKKIDLNIEKKKQDTKLQ